MDPYNQARAQSGDLTEADTLALRLGMTRASHDCVALAATAQDFTSDADQLLTLSRLCLFGQQFETARVMAVKYLALPAPPEREMALILLVRAYLGLKEPYSAEPQLLSLLRDYPYDAQIHVAADQVISQSESVGSAPESDFKQMTIEICDQQTGATLPLLKLGKSLHGRDGDVPANVLYADALRCATLVRGLEDSSANDTLRQLTEIVRQPIWQHTAELFPMEEALARVQMAGGTTPLDLLLAHQITANGAMLPRAISLKHGVVLLAPFTLWSPSAIERIRDLFLSAPKRSVYAITSWRANTGGQDAPSPEMVAALRVFQKSLPSGVPLLVVPDAELRSFHVDQFPAGIALREGIVLSNAILADEGAEHVTLRAIQAESPKPRHSNGVH
jgi:hypothetical protein